MAQHINTEGPSYKKGYADGYEVAQHMVADAQADADDRYSRGFKDGQDAARDAWRAWFATLPTELAAQISAFNHQHKAA